MEQSKELREKFGKFADNVEGGLNNLSDESAGRTHFSDQYTAESVNNLSIASDRLDSLLTMVSYDTHLVNHLIGMNMLFNLYLFNVVCCH